MKWPEQFGPGEYCQQSAGSQEYSVGNLLIPSHLLGGDQGNPENGADEIGGEEAQEDVTDPEPPQRQPQNGRQADVTEAKDPWAQGVHGEEHDEPDDPTEPGDEEVVPVAGDCRRDHEEPSDETKDRVDDSLREHEVLQIRAGQGQQSRGKDEIRREGPGEADASRDSREEAGGRRFDQRIADRDGGMATTAATPEEQPGEDGYVVSRRNRNAACRAGRTRRHDRFVPRHTVDNHIQEGTHDEPEQGAVADQEP